MCNLCPVYDTVVGTIVYFICNLPCYVYSSRAGGLKETEALFLQQLFIAQKHLQDWNLYVQCVQFAHMNEITIKCEDTAAHDKTLST